MQQLIYSGFERAGRSERFNFVFRRPGQNRAQFLESVNGAIRLSFIPGTFHVDDVFAVAMWRTQDESNLFALALRDSRIKLSPRQWFGLEGERFLPLLRVPKDEPCTFGGLMADLEPLLIPNGGVHELASEFLTTTFYALCERYFGRVMTENTPTQRFRSPFRFPNLNLDDSIRSRYVTVVNKAGAPLEDAQLSLFVMAAIQIEMLQTTWSSRGPDNPSATTKLRWVRLLEQAYLSTPLANRFFELVSRVLAHIQESPIVVVTKPYFSIPILELFFTHEGKHGSITEPADPELKVAFARIQNCVMQNRASGRKEVDRMFEELERTRAIFKRMDRAIETPPTPLPLDDPIATAPPPLIDTAGLLSPSGSSPDTPKVLKLTPDEKEAIKRFESGEISDLGEILKPTALKRLEDRYNTVKTEMGRSTDDRYRALYEMLQPIFEPGATSIKSVPAKKAAEKGAPIPDLMGDDL